MPTDIFIKSYHNDFVWLTHCLKSINRYCRGYRDIIIVIPPQDAPAIEHMGLTVEKIVLQPETGDGYRFQQIVKLQADKYTDADWIWYCDSDCVFTRQCSPDTFMANGRPIVLMTRYASLNKDRKNVPWQPGVELLLGKPVEYEFMRRHPFIYPTWLLQGFRGFIEQKFQKEFEQVMSDPKLDLSEFNALGAFAYETHRDKFLFVDTETNELESPVVHQFFSYTGPNGKENKDAWKRFVVDAQL